MANPNNTQNQYYDNQDTFDPNINDLYNNFIVPIDSIRSYFNGLSSDQQQTYSTSYQESRCHAFFRMLGFPVVSKSPAQYYSPGHNIIANLDADIKNTRDQIAANAIKNTDFIRAQNDRETQIQLVYSNIFSLQGLDATAISIGSMFLRHFDIQFSDGVQPLDYDSAQIQTNSKRVAEITRFFSASSSTFPSRISNIHLSLLTSTHIIKPFVVDPRFDNTVRPAARKIAAPFLTERSQLKIFDGQAGTPVIVKRPYIEYVLATIFSQNQSPPGQNFVNSIVNSIKSNGTTDQDLLNMIKNPKLTQNSLYVFSRFLKIIRSLITVLHDSILEIDKTRQLINWQPIPNAVSGVEAGADGATIADPTSGDPNNPIDPGIENAILSAQYKDLLESLNTNVGSNGIPDPGDFTFSGVDDMVFDGPKAAPTSYADQISKLTSLRAQIGNNGLEALKNIEIIMGEFSGLGLLDILAIQAAMWVVDPSVLVSMIDASAFNRMKLRQDLSVSSVSQSGDIIGSLSSFETAVKQMYKLIEGYIQILIYKQGVYSDIQP